MDLFDVVRACFRRWYILLPILAVAGYYSYSVYTAAKPVYYSQTAIGISPPSYRIDTAPTGMPVPRNGLLDIGGAPFVANMASLALLQPAVVNRVVSAGGMSQYNARMFPVPEATQPIPLVLIDVVAPEPDTSSKTLELVTAEFSTALENLQRQAKVPPEMMVEPFVVSPPSTPTAAMPSRTRSSMSIFVAGAGLAVVVSVIADALLSRRRKRAGTRAGAAGAAPELPQKSDDATASDIAAAPDDDSAVEEPAAEAR